MNLKELNETLNLPEVEEKDRGVVSTTFADAVRTIKKNDEARKEAVKVREPFISNPNKVKSEPLTKMYLSESLFTEWVSDFDDDYVDHLVQVYSDGTSSIDADDEYTIAAWYKELEEMTNEELLKQDIIGFAWLSGNDEEKLIIKDKYTIPGNENKVEKAINSYLNGEDLIEAKENISDKVYNDLEDIGFKVFASTSVPGYRVRSKFEKKLDKAIEVAKKYNLKYNKKPFRDVFDLDIEIER